MLNAKNKVVTVNGETTDYVQFGRGEKALVFIPGVGDGLKTVKGTARPFAFQYRQLAKDFTVYVFSRPRDLKEHTTTRDMARSLKDALDTIGVTKASVVGVSQGGMIAQWFALDYPEAVDKLVLVVTMARQNPIITNALGIRIDLAKAGDFKRMMTSMGELALTPERFQKTKWTYNIASRIGKPKSFDRFYIQAESCLTHDTYDRLGEIQLPTLVIGGEEDRITSGEAAKEVAALIPGSMLYMYDHLGHGLYEEAPDFLSRVATFCK